MKRILKAIPMALLAFATFLPGSAMAVTDIVPDKTVAPSPSSSQEPKAAAVRDHSDQARQQPQGNGTQGVKKPESNAPREPKK